MIYSFLLNDSITLLIYTLSLHDALPILGGMVAAIEKGFPQHEIQDASYEYQKAVERKEKIIVGVNEFVMEDERSEEHTSELQSLRHLVCRLLLEKKK